MRPLRTFRPEQEVQGSFADFTGGLDLRRLGVAAVTKHSPAALNIDWQPDGGFCTRRTVRPFSASVLHGEVAHLATYEAQAGITKLVVCYADGSVDTFSGTPKVPTVVLGPVNSPRFMVQANYKAYFLSPDTPSVALDGTFAAPLGGGFNTDRNNRTNANIPQAKLGVVFSGYMWIFDTFEGGTRHRSDRKSVV